MVQSYIFNGKKFCGQKMHQMEGKTGHEHITFLNVERITTCSDGKRNCGTDEEPLCIDNLFECPITDILFISKGQFDGQYSSQGYEAVEFGDGLNVLASSKAATGRPIT